MYDLSRDEAFWSDVRMEVYGHRGQTSSPALARFEEYCENYRSSPNNDFNISATGQVFGPVGNFPGLSASPLHDPTTMPWASELTAKFADTIQSEFDAFERGAGRARGRNRDEDGWRVVYPNFHRLVLAYNQRLTLNSRCFPKTMRLMSSLGLVGDNVMFNKQFPESGLKLHSDRKNYLLSGHIGVKVPDGCGMEVGGEKFSWDVGQLNIVDNTFLHRTWNDSTDSRVIFHFEFFHPDLTDAEKRAMGAFSRTWKRHVSRKKEEREKSSAMLERLLSTTASTDAEP